MSTERVLAGVPDTLTAVAFTALFAFAASMVVSHPLAPALLAMPVAVFVGLARLPAAPAFAVGATGFAAGAFAANLSRGVPDGNVSIPVIVGSAIAAGAIAIVLSRTRVLESRFGRLAPWLAIALLLAAVWLSVIHVVQTAPEGRLSLVENLSRTPRLTEELPDEGLYYVYVIRASEGVDHYVAARDTLMRSNVARDAGVDLHSPLSYRPPLLYRALGSLPRNGLAYVLATLAAASLAVVAAYPLIRRHANERIALISSALVAAFYHGVAMTPALFGTEVWAGMLGLISLSLLAAALDSRHRGPWLMAGAAAVAVLGVAVRELAVAFVILGLIATLADRTTRRSGEWALWLGALIAAVVITALHWSTAEAIARTVPGWEQRVVGRNYWFHPDGLGLVSSARRLGGLTGLQTAGGWAIIALSGIGALVASRRTAMRVALTAATLGGALLLAVLYPTGTTAGGLPPAQWSDLVTPIMLACAPLAFAPLLRKESAPAEPTDR